MLIKIIILIYCSMILCPSILTTFLIYCFEGCCFSVFDRLEGFESVISPFEVCWLSFPCRLFFIRRFIGLICSTLTTSKASFSPFWAIYAPKQCHCTALLVSVSNYRYYWNYFHFLVQVTNFSINYFKISIFTDQFISCMFFMSNCKDCVQLKIIFLRVIVLAVVGRTGVF